MGISSTVKIMVGSEGYELLRKRLSVSDIPHVRDMLNSAVISHDAMDDGVEYHMIQWNGVKWYHSYDDVSAVNKVLSELNTLVEDDCDLLEKYFFKQIELREDGSIDEATNDYDDEFVGDFYVAYEFSM